MSDDERVTDVLRRMERGESSAAGDLFPLVCEELRRKARFYMSRERRDHTLQATALVNEAFVKLVGTEPIAFESRKNFYDAASNAMRQILVDHARRKNAEKRGGQLARVDLDGLDIAQATQDIDMEALDIALNKLQRIDPRRYQVVMYRYFSGLEEKQVAELLGVALKTVQRDWKTAKTFLLAELACEDGTGEGS